MEGVPTKILGRATLNFSNFQTAHGWTHIGVLISWKDHKPCMLVCRVGDAVMSSSDVRITMSM